MPAPILKYDKAAAFNSENSSLLCFSANKMDMSFSKRLPLLQFRFSLIRSVNFSNDRFSLRTCIISHDGYAHFWKGTCTPSI